MKALSYYTAKALENTTTFLFAMKALSYYTVKAVKMQTPSSLIWKPYHSLVVKH